MHDATRDAALLDAALPALVREYTYWTGLSPRKPRRPNQHTVAIQGRSGAVHHLQRYYARTNAPRPESYREDAELAAAAPEEERKALMRHVASAAESGYDFGSRWFADGRSMRTIRTTRVLPSDLNGVLLAMERTIAALAERRDDRQLQAWFEHQHKTRRAALDDVFWDPRAGRWRDVVLPAGIDADVDGDSTAPSACEPQGRRVAPSGVTVETSAWQYGDTHGAHESVPLFCGAATAGSATARQAVSALASSGLVQPGGVAASTTGMHSGHPTGQQWDWPNAWAPHQHMLSEGVRQYGAGFRGDVAGTTMDHAELALYIARGFTSSCHVAFRRDGVMHEKMDARRPGVYGGGGEYAPQVGFGWTNGACLSFLARYGRAVL